MPETTYELVFTTATGGEDTVLVRPSGATGPGGHPVYTDASGAVRAEISGQGEVRMIATTGHQDLRPPTAVRLVTR